MVMNSGQGPGGSPVPRVLMIAGFFLVQLEKEKCRRRGRGMLFLLEEKENYTYCSYYMWKFVVFHSSLLLLLLLL